MVGACVDARRPTQVKKPWPRPLFQHSIVHPRGRGVCPARRIVTASKRGHRPAACGGGAARALREETRTVKNPVKFGKYYLLERVNVGGMAEVFKAKYFGEVGFERLVAVKRVLPSIAEDREFISMFV